MVAQDTGWRLTGLALAWLAGVSLQLQERSLCGPALYGAALVSGILLLRAGWRGRRAFVIALLGIALLGWGVTGARATLRLAEILQGSLEGRDLIVEGVIASLPQPSANGQRFRFAVERAEVQGQVVTIPSLLALGWYRNQHEDASLNQPLGGLRAGERWRFTVRLRQPHGNINPHGFDYELYLFELGVGATGYVRDAPATRTGSGVGFPVERVRQSVRDAIYASVPDRRAAGVLAALAIGDQAAIEREDWDLFRNTGVAHLMSISGLHVTMFAWLAGGLLGWIWRRSTRATLWMPVPAAARWGGLAAACGYALLAGWGVPAQRTVLMLAAVAVLQAFGAAWPWPLVMLAAATVVTCVDPWALLQPGFWLSFGAVGLLIASKPAFSKAAPSAVNGRHDRLNRLIAVVTSGVRTQLIATLGLTPLTLVFFQQVSLVGLFANLLAIPLVTLVITPLAMLGVLVAPLWSLGASVLQGLIAALSLLGGLPGAVWSVPAAPAWAQLAALVGAALLIMPLPGRIKLTALPLIMPLMMPPRPLLEPGRFELLALDVGQGTALLVRTREHLLLYDAGPQYSRESDAGQRVLLPLLRGRGEARIDRLVLSHRDSDHVGGARAVLAALAVQEVMSSLDPSHPLIADRPGAVRCEAGQSWRWDGVRFDILRPLPGDYQRALKPNALSCVLRVSSDYQSVLLTGDIEREQELALVARHGDALRSDVLVVPHHGSRSSSTAEFLDTVRPRWAIIQAGYRSRFGHPAPDVVARYVERGIVTLNSASCGAWAWPATDSESGRCLRETERRYWRHRSSAAAAR